MGRRGRRRGRMVHGAHTHSRRREYDEQAGQRDGRLEDPASRFPLAVVRSPVSVVAGAGGSGGRGLARTVHLPRFGGCHRPCQVRLRRGCGRRVHDVDRSDLCWRLGEPRHNGLGLVLRFERDLGLRVRFAENRFLFEIRPLLGLSRRVDVSNDRSLGLWIGLSDGPDSGYPPRLVLPRRFGIDAALQSRLLVTGGWHCPTRRLVLLGGAAHGIDDPVVGGPGACAVPCSVLRIGVIAERAFPVEVGVVQIQLGLVPERRSLRLHGGLVGIRQEDVPVELFLVHPEITGQICRHCFVLTVWHFRTRRRRAAGARQRRRNVRLHGMTAGTGRSRSRRGETAARGPTGPGRVGQRPARPTQQRAPRPPGRAIGPQRPIGQVHTRVESLATVRKLLSGGGGI